MSSEAYSNSNFSRDEIADAYETLVLNQQEFLSDSPFGKALRRDALDHFKRAHPECSTIEQIAMTADLEGDIDVKNACTIEMNVEKYTERLVET